MMQSQYEVIVIGAGIAGASLAAELCTRSKTLVLETESQPGYHTTGRSAAMFAQTYGPPPIRALTRASKEFFDQPPEDFCPGALLSERGVVMLARENQLVQLEELIAEVSTNSEVMRLNSSNLTRTVPLLKPGYGAAGMYDANSKEIDVAALHQGYLRKIKKHGGQILTNAQVTSMSHGAGGWTISSRAGEFRCEKIVNAAGAWADEIGAMAGATKINLAPKRRTVAIIAAPETVNIENMPLIVDIDEEFYLKPDAGRLLISPADETPSPACDAQPEDIDIAICAERIETAFSLEIRRIENKWAGLRSFVADGCPVVGFDTPAPGFFWLAGQGGYGIQSAPALARLAAAQIFGENTPDDLLAQGLNLHDISIDRFSESS